MKIIYTNISPITNAYTNLNHIFHLKKQNPQKVYLCVWDNFVFENPIYEKSINNKEKKSERLQENVRILEKLMTHLKIDYKIIYLSEAMNRLLRNPYRFSEFQTILANIKIENLSKGLEINYIPFNEISVSKINYIIADYLIATSLPELFPDLCSSQPTHYLTSERFRAFHSITNHCLKTGSSKYVFPKCLFVTGVPVIMHSDKKTIPSLEMSFESIKQIVRNHYKKMPQKKEIHDLSNVLFSVLSKLIFKDRKIGKREIEKIIEKMTYSDFIDFTSLNLYNYFHEINKITSKIKISNQKQSYFIKNYEEFNSKIKPLNSIKLEILKNCNGNNSSLDISRKTGLKLSTVSTYISHLKNQKIIDDAKKPRRLIDSFVIDLEVLDG